MNRKFLILFAILLIGLGVVIYSVFIDSPEVVTQTGQETQSTTEADDGQADIIVPTFDVVRLEPNGSIVVAGQAEPNSLVELLTQSEQILGSERAVASGDFVITPSGNLSGGNYVLHLRATNSQNQQITSRQTATIYVPENEGDEVLVIVNEEGQPSRILSKPSELALEQTNENSVDLKIEAVEVEENRIYVAGAVNKDVLVRLYINNNVLGLARGSQQNRFLLEKEYELQSGSHVVRADVIDEKDGSVLARVQVDLLHEVAGDSGEAIRTGTHVISIKKGDTLWHISQKFYGSGFRYTTIYNANREQIVDPDLIYVGQVFKVPESANE